MGIATIVSGGEDGRYTISMDYGAATKAALLAASNALLVQIELRQFTAAARLVTAEEMEAEQVARVKVEMDRLIAASLAPQAPGGNGIDTRAVTFEMLQLAKLRQSNEPLRMQIAALKFSRAQTLARVVYWNDVTTTDTRQAWCTTLTEDAAPGALVGTVDIPGDTNLMLIAPECRAPTNDDGFFRARAVLSPEQAFFNAAIFPGWQKWKPTYRWGTITAMDEAAETVTVELATTTSSAQTLNVNQATILTDVEVEYMSCGASVFEVGDRVVVQFVGQDWDSPMVIGFVDNPRPCNFPCILLDGGNYYFESLVPEVMASILASGTYEARRNSGAWQTMGAGPNPDTSTYRVREILYDSGGISPPADEPTQVAWLTVQDVGIPLYPAFISLLVSPRGPFPPPRSEAAREVVEFRVRVGGETVFNAAVKDMGWAGEGVTIGLARSRGGINLRNIGAISGRAVHRLEYTLDP
jgi:hypothetical protein